MLKKKSLAPAFFWNFSPSTTPELSPTSSDSDSDEDMESSGSRPVSVAVSAGAFCPMRPTLKEASRYRETYHTLSSRFGPEVLTRPDSRESQHLLMLWQRLMTAYILPGAPREVNLSSEVRDALLQHGNVTLPPAPETLDSAVQRIHDLMEESIFMPFLNSQAVSPSVEAQADSPISPDDVMDLSHISCDDHSMKYFRSRTKRISPQSSTKDLSTTAGRSSSSFSAMQALGKRASGALLSPSGDSYTPPLTDDSTSQSSPTTEEPMTPPTTPPASDLNQPISSPKYRTENPWKKMGLKLGFKKRSGGSNGNSRDPKILSIDD
ncbi:Uncharacterized protein PECH_007017 [Penicillium ucsense]|uniref:RGS domain-containing protein n=1 Tax=Penicillium ucsense TaxID=2839758 RepID=A0A8J8W148_9EURO|nr:Uncharacterized protein PECM_006823 [Penicillium ucsense]KAF7735222.1 Uncharacterized protein PECH_007017 [Penicillium ucsense]